MEFLVSFPTPMAMAATILIFLLPFLYTLVYISKAKTGKNKTAPQAAGAWPIIGHLHLLGGSQLPHKTLGKLAEKYGPIFTIKLGVQRALVVSDPEMAKECLTTNDKVFATRPKSVAVELMGYNYAMFGLGPYGDYWRHVRKIAVLELLSQRRLEMLANIRVSEVKALIKNIYELCNKNHESGAVSGRMVKIEMKRWFGSTVLNIIIRMMSGKRFSPEDEVGVEFQEVVRKFLELLGVFVLSDAVPYMRWLDLGGYEKVMKKTSAQMDSIFDGWLQEHKRRRNSGQQNDGEQVFMDVMISILEGASKDDLPSFDPDTIIKSTCLAVLTAAIDTTTVTLTWALSLLLNNPKVLRNALNEIDTYVGSERQLEESDMKNLVYLQAIIKETLRLYPPVPLSLPHESMEDCIVGGYEIPKGTRLLVNVWKIHHDPNVWSDPYEFRPERFLTSQKAIDFRGQNFELIPFGSGRRICPGISFAQQVIQLILASLIHAFELRNPSTEPIDMTESIGLTNLKATPLEVLSTPRLSPNLYQ